ncbi:MAG TPA: M48 family metalloprotease [Tepidisphaeraceae bacterium]|nr:M48 family metalloprotease [Tepidisphaeraceae bacterium]
MLRILFIFVVAACSGCTATGGVNPDWTRWAQQQGGLLHDQREGRARETLARLSGAGAPTSLTIHVLDSSIPTAYAWPGGAIFVTRGLVDLLPSQDELTAVVAHEVGHLVDGGHFHSVMTLGGCNPSTPDAESRADDLACHLLQNEQLPGDSLIRALQKVQASRYLSAACRQGLQQRIGRLAQHMQSSR